MSHAAAPLTAAALAELVGGRVEGDGSLEIHAVGPLDRAHGAALSFLTTAKYLDQFSASGAGAVLVPEGFTRPSTGGPVVLISVRDPQR